MSKNVDIDTSTLYEWLLKHNVNNEKELDEYKKLFYKLDLNMKNLHLNNYYVDDFNINNIMVGDNFVSFNSVKKLSFENKDYLIHKNIYYLSCLALGVYNDCLQYINPENSKGIRDNFSVFSEFIPTDLVPYYRGIFVNNANVYLSDYVKARLQREQQRQQSILDSSSSSSSNKKVSTYSKSTLIGKLYSDTEDNKSAFIQIILFPVIILLMAILIPIMLILAQ